jgi:hypothetical protein
VTGTPRVFTDTMPFSAAGTYSSTTPYATHYTDPRTSTYPMEPTTSTAHNRGTSPAPRIPTPAALQSSSPLELPALLPTSSSSSTPSISNFPNPNSTERTSSTGAWDSHSPSRLALLRSPSSSGLGHLPSLSMHLLTGMENENQESSGRTRPGPLDLGWLTQQLDEALPSPRALELFTSTAPDADSSRSHGTQVEHSRVLHPRPGSTSDERSGRLFRALPLMRRVRSPPPSLGSTREFMSSMGASFGSSSVDSGIPTSAISQRRVPLPWVDLEHDGMGESASSGFVGDTSSRVIDSTSSVMGSDGTSSPFYGPMLSPGLGGSLSPIADGTSSPPFGGLASPMGMESVASTVQSDDGPIEAFAADTNNMLLPSQERSNHIEGHSTTATFGSPSTSGSSASARTTPSGYTRRPPPLSLRGFPTSPTFSAMSGPVSTSPSFIMSESPTFPASASPRTSTFDLGVTPPGSALPSFVARMMEVDSPVREGKLHQSILLSLC